MTLLPHPRTWSAVVVALFMAAAAAAAPVTSPPAGDQKKDDSPAEKVRKALDQVTDIAIENQPLALAIQQLGEQSKINFVVDTFTVQNQLGIDLQGAVVNVKLSGVKLHSALRTLLSQHNLSYAVLGDTVLITTEEMAMHRQMRQRISVEAEKQPLTQALKQLSRNTGTNVLVDTRVTKESQIPVTLQLEDVPLETAVRLLGAMAGLKTVRVGNVLFVTNKVTADEMRQDTDLVQPNPQLQKQLEMLRGQLGGAPFAGFGLGGGQLGGLVPQLLNPVQPVPALPQVAPAPNPPDPPKEGDKSPPPPEDKPKD